MQPAITPARQLPSWLGWLGFVVLCNGVGALSAMTSGTGLYRELVRPGWSPPSWLFGPVWTALYIAMGTATWRVWTRTAGRHRRRAMTVFGIQLALNAAWTPVFFGLQQPFAALIVLTLVWLGVLAMTVVYARHDRLAAILVVPLALWVSFAGALNAAIWWLNR